MFTQLCKSSEKIFRWSLNNYNFAEGTQKSLCAGFDKSVIHTNAIAVWSYSKNQ